MKSFDAASRLRALFKAETKQTIPQYVKERELGQARKLLGMTYLRISLISAKELTKRRRG